MLTHPFSIFIICVLYKQRRVPGQEPGIYVRLGYNGFSSYENADIPLIVRKKADQTLKSLQLE